MGMTMFHTNCCDAQWTGYLTCHCTSCHQTFTGITAFDAHRTGSFTDSGEKVLDDKGVPRGPRRCLPPANVGLVDACRAYPYWGYPKSEAWWEEAEQTGELPI